MTCHSYAKVRLASHRESGELFAIKIIKKPEVDQEKHYTRIKREVENLKGVEVWIWIKKKKIYLFSSFLSLVAELGHPNIIQLHDVFQTKRFICIVMEFASGGDLFDYIRTKVSRGSWAKFHAAILSFSFLWKVEACLSYDFVLIHSLLLPSLSLATQAIAFPGGHENLLSNSPSCGALSSEVCGTSR